MILASWMCGGFGALLVLLAIVLLLQGSVTKRPVLHHTFSTKTVWKRALLLAGLGVLLLGVAGAILVFVVPREAARDRAVNDFIEAVRRNDENGVRAAAAEGAVFDKAFLDRAVRPSREFKPGNMASGSADACVRGMLLPNREPIVFSLVAVGDQWKVRRAAPKDPECDYRLDD